ncbi:MAG TPA: hypothetical protein VGJ07_19345, partial [Rugosimonospora sp.]
MFEYDRGSDEAPTAPAHRSSRGCPRRLIAVVGVVVVLVGIAAFAWLTGPGPGWTARGQALPGSLWMSPGAGPN